MIKDPTVLAEMNDLGVQLILLGYLLPLSGVNLEQLVLTLI